MSLVKLIHSSSWDPTIGVGAEIVRREGELNKQASTIFGKEYDELKPDDKSVGIHVVALGDAEHYGMNRNGDLFSKKACVEYHPTFLDGCVYRHHRNKDPETQGIGKIAAATYNEDMGRVELFIHADKEKAAPELERLEKEGEIPFSMACVVPNDRCSICGSLRKSAGDESECEHVRDHLGEQWDDGRKVGTFNDQPKFFDISFVGRPADRIAWNLKVASALDLDSVKYAEYEGVTAPDDLMVEKESSVRKLGYARDIVDMQNSFRGWLTKSASVVTARDGYLYEFRKIAADSLDDATLSRLRELPVKSAMSILSRRGIVMDVPTFFKYATGDDYKSVVEPYMEPVERTIPHLVESLVKTSSVSPLCNDDTYDSYDPSVPVSVPSALESMLAKHASSVGDRIMDATMDDSVCRPVYFVDTKADKCVNGGVVQKLASAYLSYQLSAIDAVVNGHSGISKTDAEALASVNNLQKK
jgi:hypothetical protein